MNTAHQFRNAPVNFTPAKSGTISTPSSTFTNSPTLSSSSTATAMTPETPTQQQPLENISDKYTHESAYVHSLVDMTVRTLDSIWPTAHGPSSARTVDTGTFVKTILRLSRTRHSTLLIAIFYLFRIKPRLQKSVVTSSLEDRRYLMCSRRMFLVALLLACKYQNDITPKNSVWARVSGLPVAQINQAERLFLSLLDYQLFISKESYEQWTGLVERHCERNKNEIRLFGNNKDSTIKSIDTPLLLVNQENQQSFMHHSSDLVKKRRVHTKNDCYASEPCAVTHQLPTPPATTSNEFVNPTSTKRKWPTA